MKVSANVRDLWTEQRRLALLVERSVKLSITASIPKEWHFYGRVKEEESFALKLESARFMPGEEDDMYAATIVVPTVADLEAAEKLVTDTFVPDKRKPIKDDFTHMQPHEFLFDHIRLYLRLKPAPGLVALPVHEMLFELQIKTYLQHAWAIATHDLTYKTENVSWPTGRIAAQIKAMLEMAEVSILEAKSLSESSAGPLRRTDKSHKRLKQMIAALKEHFDIRDLPTNLKRLAENSVFLFDTCKIPVTEASAILSRGRSGRGGNDPSNLSPYSVLLQYVVDQRTADFIQGILSDGRGKIFVSSAVELPAGVVAEGSPRAIVF